MPLQEVGVKLVAEDARQFDRTLQRASQSVSSFGSDSRSAGSGVQLLGKESQSASRMIGLSGDAMREAGDAAGTLSSGLRSTERTYDSTTRAARVAERSMRHLKTASITLVDALGSLGLAFGAAEIVQFGLGAMQSANQLEATQASVRALAGDTVTYNEILRVAREQQRSYGGTLNDNIAQLGSLATTARNAGVGIEDLNMAAKRLLILDPSATMGDATIALREAMAGDLTSLRARFELSRQATAALADESLSGAEKMVVLNDVLNEQGATLEAVTAASETTAGSYTALGAAASNATDELGGMLSRGLEPAARGLTGVVNNVTMAFRSFENLANESQQATRGYEGFIEAQSAYQSVSEDTQAQFSGEIGQLTALQQEHRNAIVSLLELQVTHGEQSAAYQAQLMRTNMLSGMLEEQSRSLADTITGEEARITATREQAEQQAHDRALAEARAAGDIGAALALMRQDVELTEDQFEELNETIQKSAEEGAQAFGDAVQTETTFLQERERTQQEHAVTLDQIEQQYQQNRAATAQESNARVQSLIEAHNRKIADLENDYGRRMVGLQEDFNRAETDSQRASIQERMNDLSESHQRRIADAQASHQRSLSEQQSALNAELTNLETNNADKIRAQNERFKEQERIAAEEYARQQAAQLAHLGQMLIDYVTAQATLHGVSESALQEMTASLRAEYGVQTSLVDRSFADMKTSMDAWVANGGQNTGQYIQQQQQIRQNATQTQQQVDAAIQRMTSEATAAFQRGDISAQQYAEQLRKIPAAAEAAAGGTVNALNTIPREITTVHKIVTQGGASAGRGAADLASEIMGRARGGPVGSSSLYEVTEPGVGPELLTYDGRQYLMTPPYGSGMVEPMSGRASASGASAGMAMAPSLTLNLSNQFSIAGGGDNPRQMVQQISAAIESSVVEALLSGWNRAESAQ
jgi:hypothetical protein